MSLQRKTKSPNAIAEARIENELREKTRQLDLSELGLTILPESLGKLNELQSLSLSDNQITNIPESIGKLSSLETLDVRGNQLTSLPESLFKLTRLQTLYVWGNQLTSLPVGIRELRTLSTFSSMKTRRSVFRWRYPAQYLAVQGISLREFRRVANALNANPHREDSTATTQRKPT
jgi:Leucine-rich repeat (LRR) protein